MKLIKNSGTNRVIDELRRHATQGGSLDIATPAFSLFAFAELEQLLGSLRSCRLVLPNVSECFPAFLGGESDRAFRNRLQGHWLAKQCSAWLQSKVNVRRLQALSLSRRSSLAAPIHRRNL